MTTKHTVSSYLRLVRIFIYRNVDSRALIDEAKRPLVLGAVFILMLASIFFSHRSNVYVRKIEEEAYNLPFSNETKNV
ncbi:MAG: hypothetical protein KatS3mg080_0892 [Anoxybacillus sp.]|nr:MAG: hypothetical protein KatS3mg080_0892 [Anoxybacillus sp.]